MNGIEVFKQTHPVLQNLHTGKWGFDRVLNGLDLSRCIYKSKKAAEMARSVAARCYADNHSCPNCAELLSVLYAWLELIIPMSYPGRKLYARSVELLKQHQVEPPP